MKCEKCNHENPEESKFCEECGEALIHTKKTNTVNLKTPIADELDDVIFTPKKEDHTVRNIFLILAGVVGIIFILFVIIIIAALYRESTVKSTATTGANGDFNITCLTLNEGNMEGNSYYIQNPTYKATIHSSCATAVKDVVVRVNFYQADCTSVNCTPLDTEYITVASYLAPNDSYSIDQVIKTNADTSGRFRWYAQVYTATPL